MVLRSEGSLKSEMLSLAWIYKYVDNTSVLSINKTDRGGQLKRKGLTELDSLCSGKLIFMLSDRQNSSYAKSTVNSIFIYFNPHRVSE